MREKKIRANETRKKDKQQVHCVGLHSAKHTHTHAHKQIKQQEEKKEKREEI